MRRSLTTTWGSAVVVALFAMLFAQPLHAQTTALPSNTHNVSLSGNGRFVVYTLATSSTSGIWIYDRHTGQHERADVSSAGTAANHNSINPGVSATGRFVVFWSRADNLVAGDTNLVNDIFVRDRQTGLTTRETFHATNANVIVESGQYLSISSDGRYVVFDTAHSLVAADINTGRDVYVRDRTLGTYTMVTVSTAGQASPGPNGGGAHGRMSADGRFVTFTTYDANALVPGIPGPSFGQILVRDLQTSQTTLVSRSTAGALSSGYSEHPTISADGRFVAFISTAADLVAGDTNGGYEDAFVHDRDTGETTMVSVSSAGVQANVGAIFSRPSISADGRYIAFASGAGNLVPMDTNGAEDIFVRDRVFQTTFRATLRGDQSEAPPCPGGTTTREQSMSDSGIDMVVTTYLALAGPCPSLPATYLRRVWPASASDFNIDRVADVTVFRPGISTWFTRLSATTGAAWQWGAPGDIPTAADFDGDGRTDYAVFRPSTGVWYWLHSWTNGSSYRQYAWGQAGDIPAPGDYDGDGKADPTVFRPSTGTWFAKLSGTNFATNLILQFGANGDVPVAADYDGDRTMDIAVYRPATGVWYIRHSSTGAVVIRQWGNSTDITVPGDYDGDERADIAVYRPSEGAWYLARSTTDFATYEVILWGVGSDVPVAADYNGDGRVEPAVFRPSSATWWVYNQFALFWGTTGDIPIGGR